MFYYTSFYRHRDANDKIVGYTLRNEKTFEWMQVSIEQLKDAMYNKRVHIFNLKLTSDDIIIESPNPLPMHNQNNRLNEQNSLLSSVIITNDNDDLGYNKNLARKEILERRVKFDGIFEINKIMRIFTIRRQGRIKGTSCWD